MTNTVKNTEALDDDILAAIDGLDAAVETTLDDLDDMVQTKGEIDVNDLLGITEEQPAEASAEETQDVEVDLGDIDQIVAEVEASEAAQEAQTEKKPKKKAEAPAEEEKPAEAKKTPKKRVAPDAKASVALSAKVGTDADKFKLSDGDVSLSEDDLEKHHQELTAMLDTLPVKCQKKAVNILSYMNGGNLSCFIDIALKELIDRKEMTTADLKAVYVNGSHGRPYGESTANAQTGNIFKTFDALRIADRHGSTLKIREDSLIIKKAKSDFAAAA